MKKWIALAAALLPLTVTAASISVSPLRLDFKHQDRFKDLTIYNTGKDTAYVAIAVNKVLNPGAKERKLQPMKGANLVKFGLISAHSKLIIPAGGFRVVRLMVTRHNNIKDMVYDIDIKPVLHPLLGPVKAPKHVEGGIRVVVGYEVNAVIHPKNPKPILVLKRKQHQLTARNDGNTYILLYEGKQCNASGKVCKTFPEKMLYAGNRWSLKLPYNTPVKFKTFYLGHHGKAESE